MDELLVAIQEAADTIAAPNWADIMSVCFSLAAVVVACIVAWRQNEISREQTEISKKQTEISQEQAAIADKQNRISLFEKRFEIYDILSACRSSVQIAETIGKNDDVLEFLFYLLVKNNSGTRRKFDRDEARPYFTDFYTKLRRAAFFFPEEITSHIIDVSNKMFFLAQTDPKDDGLEKYSQRKQEYFEAIKDLDKNKVLESIEAEMRTI